MWLQLAVAAAAPQSLSFFLIAWFFTIDGCVHHLAPHGDTLVTFLHYTISDVVQG
jgi:hypothetical protein